MFKHKNKKYIKTRKGFTLIELLLVITIIGIMTAVVLTFIGQSKNETQLESSANAVVAIIRKVQNYSLTGKDIESGCSNYSFNATAGTASFNINNGGGSCSLNENYQLGHSVVFANDVSITFSAPFGDKTPANVTTDISIAKASNNYHICVTEMGVITKQKTACP